MSDSTLLQPSPTPLAVYIQTLRRGMGIQQADLAKQIGLSVRQLSRFESGESQQIGSGVMLRALAVLPATLKDLIELVQTGADPVRAAELAQAQLTAMYSQMRSEPIPAESVEHLRHILEMLEDPERAERVRQMIHARRT
jgi:transcriptional regulator with XRE-family HTH domain